MNHTTHPWQVAVYVGSTTTPVRVFDGYYTEQDAMWYADHLREQITRDGSTHIVRVAKRGLDSDAGKER